MSTALEQDAVRTANQSEPQPPVTQPTTMTLHEEPMTGGSIAAFASPANYESAKRMATALASSTIVPDTYRNSAANCLVALELSARTGASVLMVMQNLYLVKGKPGWSAVFLIGSVNTCGRFSPLRYEIKGEDPSSLDYRVRAVARDVASGDLLEGEWITWKLVKAEGWESKNDSKWKSMPGQMFRYRAASFWVKTYAPEISLGMQTAEEVEDYTSVGSGAAPMRPVSDLNAALKGTARVVDPGVPGQSAPVSIETVVCEDCGRGDGTHESECPHAD